MPRPGELLPHVDAPTLQRLRDHAWQLAKLADRLTERDPPANETSNEEPAAKPFDPSSLTHARSVAAHLIQLAGHRAIRVRSSFAAGSHEFGDPLVRRLHGELLARGAELAVLVPHRLLLDDEAFDWLTEWTLAGAQVRISAGELPTASVFDGRLALVTPERGAPAKVVDDPEAAQAMAALHQAIWGGAVDLSSAGAYRTDDVSAARVLQTVSQGYTDEAAARDLGLSVRTYRRHVADLLTRLNATSRFQAGVRAAQLGLINAPI